MFVDSPFFLGVALLSAWVLVMFVYHYPAPSRPVTKQSTVATGTRPNRSVSAGGSTATCPDCGTENDGEYRFCRDCATPVRP